MSDERIVEVMAKAALFFDLDETQDHAVELVERQLAALRGAGYDVYRPDDCELIEAQPRYGVWVRHAEQLKCISEKFPPGFYRLVPVGGDS